MVFTLIFFSFDIHNFQYIMQSWPVVTSYLIIIMAIILYMMPTLIAKMREHHNTIGLGLLNMFFGWTVIGWFGALIWSFSTTKKVSQTIHHQDISVGQELERLKNLHEEGILTQEEFVRQKQNLLG